MIGNEASVFLWIFSTHALRRPSERNNNQKNGICKSCTEERESEVQSVHISVRRRSIAGACINRSQQRVPPASFLRTLGTPEPLGYRGIAPRNRAWGELLLLMILYRRRRGLFFSCFVFLISPEYFQRAPALYPLHLHSSRRKGAQDRGICCSSPRPPP